MIKNIKVMNEFIVRNNYTIAPLYTHSIVVVNYHLAIKWWILPSSTTYPIKSTKEIRRTAMRMILANGVFKKKTFLKHAQCRNN